MRIVFDLTEMKVGCALLQAAMGGDPSICYRIDAKHWTVALTPDLKVYEITPQQFGDLAQKLETIR